MNDSFYKIFAKIPDKPVPPNLHNAILLRVLFIRAERLVAIGVVIVSLSFAFSLWHLYIRLTELDFVSVAQSIISTVEFDLDSIIDIVRSISSFTPFGATLSALFNFCALCLVFYLMRALKQMEHLGI